ncbi:ROK family protein [Pseudochryseolinea flava]|uniref:ROK family protein n=1 Tax=Pseudochryseolinea flava TaxID=2059302 RepID=A0A364Y2K2_9BACT|nr:ROK family protein [Pseudochryseolinea flava]RAW00190.1 ROK family protein [Pseudochryseolinea flava]
MYTIGADVGGSHISTCLFEHSNKVLMPESLVVKKVDRNASKEDIVSDWAAAIKLTAKNVGGNISGIGLAVPGPFDYYNGISLIKGVDKFESLYNVNIREALAEALDIAPKSIRFINDASAFTIAETSLGEARNFDRCVGITLGTGFGSSFTEFGKPVLKSEDVPVGGFLYDKLHHGQLADEIFSTRGIIQSYFDRSEKRCDSVQQIALHAENDLEARETFSEFGKELGLFLLPYLQTFEAKVVVLGGNICRAYHLFKDTLQLSLSDYKVYVSSYGEKAAMIGAARLLDDQYYSQIEETLKDM